MQFSLERFLILKKFTPPIQLTFVYMKRAVHVHPNSLCLLADVSPDAVTLPSSPFFGRRCLVWCDCEDGYGSPLLWSLGLGRKQDYKLVI